MFSDRTAAAAASIATSTTTNTRTNRNLPNQQRSGLCLSRRCERQLHVLFRFLCLFTVDERVKGIVDVVDIERIDIFDQRYNVCNIV
jgi:hypothetical protein